MALITFTMWNIASVSLAAEMLFMLLPWSFGWIQGTDALLARTLFWFPGHPIVYFWLLPGYTLWYTMVPKQAEGRLFSDPMARASFILFLILSIPVGIHHQYADPGVHRNSKLLHPLPNWSAAPHSTPLAIVSGNLRGAFHLQIQFPGVPWE
jgi:cytochrome c oxidase subunit 1